MFRYNELSQKTRFQSARIAALCLHNIQRENLVFIKSLSTSYANILTVYTTQCIPVRIQGMKRPVL